MSAFSGLSTALSSLRAQRQALDATGQNIANANTKGYTRQRVDMTAVSPLQRASMSTSSMLGAGVSVTGVTRLGDSFLDARLRSESAVAGFQSSRAEALARLETTLTEPSDKGLAAGLTKFWASWQDVANAPEDPAARKVLLGDARALVDQIGAGYRAVETQWDQTRTEVDATVSQVNTAATGIAQLNEQIRSITVSGGNANELIDRRNSMVTELSKVLGATGRENADGTLDVIVDGNALVRGVKANVVTTVGAYTMAGATQGASPAVVALTWASSGTPVNLSGGELASQINNLAPVDQGGVYAYAAGAYDDIAQALMTSVNTVHATGQTTTTPPTTGVDFFTRDVTAPFATGLSVAITDPNQVAVADPTKGALDGSIADAISQLATMKDGPDSKWRSFTVDLGVNVRAAEQRADVTEANRATAERLVLSQGSVDIDEETVNLLAYQRAYEGAARVLTTVDQMLDVLINRTGVVGR